MKTIQITINPELLQLIDKECGVRNRSGFFRQAAQAWLAQLGVRKLEAKQIQGYTKYPVNPGEFNQLVAEQVWSE